MPLRLAAGGPCGGAPAAVCGPGRRLWTELGQLAATLAVLEDEALDESAVDEDDEDDEDDEEDESLDDDEELELDSLEVEPGRLSVR